MDNINSAAIGEYIVTKAMGIFRSPESSWESFDILSPEGIKIEVKTAGLVQIWQQKKPSVPSYDIKQKSGWSGETSEYDGIITRQADVYVFCLHHEKDPATCNPLSSDAWSFYVVATNDIDQKLGTQKSVGISTIENILGCRPVSYDELSGKIIEVGSEKSNRKL
ncbi:hypothetical protein [Marinilabilia salmonicolor]|uniref:hypothetical protein n=1 Tax=Marinilabilia salmonicolor TaxID=989 RepID=UPI0011C06791|nr:hypothetical protein [Marinilabilia salmonicolor]